MKKIIALAIAAFFFTNGTNAQLRRIQDSSFEHQKNHQRKTMIKDNWNNLNLTNDQKQKMKESQERHKMQREAILKDPALTAEQKKAKMMDIQKSNRDLNEGILTAEQKAILKHNEEKRRSDNKMNDQKDMKDLKGKMGEGNNNEMKGMKENKEFNDLDISPAQQRQMKDLNDKMKAESMVIKKNNGLSQEQRKQQLQDLREKSKEQRKEILTPEQKLKMKKTQNNQGKQRKIKNKDGK